VAHHVDAGQRAAHCGGVPDVGHDHLHVVRQVAGHAVVDGRRE
jgi:hypothetical protein